jgi:hypothetical protein
MSRRSDQWLYLGLGLTGFLALVSYRSQKPPTPKPPDPKGETKSVEYQVDNGKILVSAVSGSEFTTPRLAPEYTDKFQAMVSHWKEWVDEAVLDYRVPESWMWAIMWAESRGDPKAKSPAGAIGLMQVMPYHFKSGEEPFDPRTNIRAGARYLQTIRAKVSDLVQAASMYNAGGPWTNETWLAAHRKPSLTTKWGYPAEKGYIDVVVAANNTFLTLGIGTS